MGGGVASAGSDSNCERIACGIGIGICSIVWDGRIVNCVSDFDAGIVQGDVNKESIKEIWKRRNEKFLRLHMEHKWNELPDICKNCTDWAIVGEERFDENGNPVQKNYGHEGKRLEN